MELMILTTDEAKSIKEQRFQKQKEQMIAEVWNDFIDKMKALDVDLIFVVDKYGYKGAGTHQVSKATIDYKNRLVLHMA